MNERQKALRKFLMNSEQATAEELQDEITESMHCEEEFETPYGDYLVLDDDEAEKLAEDYIKDSVWAFNADFLSSYLVDGTLSSEDIDRLRGDRCEDINDVFLSMLGDNLECFISDAISSDGRGHFMNSYDGEEHEQGEFYIYRTN